VPVGDAQGLARETAALLLDEEARLRVAAEARVIATRENADHTAHSFETLYESLSERA
jgi:hypothetical protein